MKKNMKKVLMILLAMSLVCIMAVGSTMSYLTYTDYDVNTMVVGNVEIEQLEQKRNGTVFENHVKLLPVVEVAGTEKSFNNYDLYNHRNIVDKIVTVKNTGSEDAYIRTIFAFEMMKVDGAWVNPLDNSADKADVLLNVNGTMSFGTTDIVIYKDAEGSFTTESTNATAAYVIGWYEYNAALSADATSAPSLLQVYLASHVGNEFFTAVGNQYEIIVLSQAVQTTGFDGANTALVAAFGEINAANAAEWFQENGV